MDDELLKRNFLSSAKSFLKEAITSAEIARDYREKNTNIVKNAQAFALWRMEKALKQLERLQELS